MTTMSKKAFFLAAAAALLITSSAAQARGISFNVDGQKIRIVAARHCYFSLSCLRVSDNGMSINMKHMNRRGGKASDVVEVASNAPDVALPTPSAPAPSAPAQAAQTTSPATPPAAADKVPPAPAPVADASRATDATPT